MGPEIRANSQREREKLPNVRGVIYEDNYCTASHGYKVYGSVLSYSEDLINGKILYPGILTKRPFSWYGTLEVQTF